MAAESALQVVEKLQARLAANPDPKKETGVGKTVNSLRKHEHVGSFARDLVAQWKKLVPVERNTEPDEQDCEKNDSRKRPRDALQKEEEEEVEADYQENWKASSSQQYSPDHRQKKHRKLSEFERPLKVAHSQERKRGHRASPVYSSDHESSDYGHVQSPPSSGSPPQMSADHYRSPDEDHEPFVPQQKPGKGHSSAFQDRLGASQERHLGEPRGKGVVSQNKEHKSPHKEKRPVGARGEEKSPLSREKSHKAISKEETRRPLSGDGTKEKAPSSGIKKEKDREGSSKKFLSPLETASDNHRKKPKHKDAEKTKSDKNKQSLDSLDRGKGAGDLPPKAKEKVSNNLKTHEGKGKTPSDRKSGGSLPRVEETDVDDEFEQPTMSFESYLSYDQPRKKKKKVVKASTATAGEKALKKKDSKSTSKSVDAVPKSPKVNENKSERHQAAGAEAAKPRKVPTDVLPVLPDLPLPVIQANYRPLPSLDLIASFQPKRKAHSSQEEDEAGFTGRRMNSKMQVYSGSKCAYLPKMMTLHQQCIRVLKNNIDSIFEVGGVPYSLLEPVLERCTPDQLYRIEEYNHVLIEETDKLWKVHCHRDFKEERPEEYESWREMYLRLQDAREQRLQLLTKNIRSAHANKPKGRQAKMAFVHSVAKPPRDVRRRQEKFGTGGAAVPEKIRIKPAPYPIGSSQAPSNSGSSNSFPASPEEPAYDGPSTSSAHLAPVVSTVSYDPRKPTVKKIAPMMAKTIKAFKNRFSRR
ncbi:elongin-A isoform X2 [Pipistrellus kuhlii]|uniref:elongin-A isoform X2 n=1 Tax=Pipistrellus kuhlii TaxID=59472 RepID=UPI00174F69A8|nr:elongin-A isoform X2 [Pipistrellus kuhlii]